MDKLPAVVHAKEVCRCGPRLDQREIGLAFQNRIPLTPAVLEVPGTAPGSSEYTVSRRPSMDTFTRGPRCQIAYSPQLNVVARLPPTPLSPSRATARTGNEKLPDPRWRHRKFGNAITRHAPAVARSGETTRAMATGCL